MALLNVHPDKQSDPFYRYKMPRILTKVEGNGNGIKTVVVNIADVSERLARNVEYPMRFFAHEMAATSKLKDDKWILMGQHSQDRIQECVFDFIRRFVLCKACGNPETVFRVDVKKNIFMDCKACSCTTDIAPTEKLCNAILKYEKPVADEPKAKDKDKKDKKEKNKDDKKEKKEKKEKEKKTRDEKEEENFERATRQVADGDAILSEEIDRPNPVTVLQEFINQTPAPSVDDFVGKVLDLKEEYGLTEDKLVVTLVFEALFDKDIVKQFPARHKWLKRFVKTSVEKDLISNLMFLCKDEEALKLKFHILLKKFYDTDMISDESIVSWFEKKKKPKGVSKDDFELFLKKSAPFVEWLQQDDDDDDDDSDEDSSDEGANGKAPSPPPKSPVDNGGPKKTTESSAQNGNPSADDDDDDIDIDAI